MSADESNTLSTSEFRISPSTSFEIERFLYREAELLDERRFEEWLALFADDLEYKIPMRVTREAQASEIEHAGSIMCDSKATLAIRVQRLGTEYAWAEQPPSRTRHFVSNIRADQQTDADGFDVRSNLLVYRNRGGNTTYDLYSADRSDVLRFSAGRWQIAQRTVVLDQASVTGNSLSIFF